jgi:lysophospholipase L1-like esterase
MYVVAIGTNDIRYNDSNLGAVTSESYIENISAIAQHLSSLNPDATLWFIAPWISTDGDRVSSLDIEEVNAGRAEYSEALSDFCDETGAHYIDPNDYIASVIFTRPQSDYLLDWIHPNGTEGIYLYCEAVLEGS